MVFMFYAGGSGGGSSTTIDLTGIFDCIQSLFGQLTSFLSGLRLTIYGHSVSVFSLVLGALCIVLILRAFPIFRDQSNKGGIVNSDKGGKS